MNICQLTKPKKKYDIQYAKDKLKRIPLDVKKEKYDEIKTAADAVGEPVNGYIKKAIDERIKRENAILYTGQPTAHATPKQKTATTPNARSEKRYKPFTEADAQRLDLPELLSNTRYQLDIALTFGDDVLSMLLETARQQEAKQATSEDVLAIIMEKTGQHLAIHKECLSSLE